MEHGDPPWQVTVLSPSANRLDGHLTTEPTFLTIRLGTGPFEIIHLVLGTQETV